jgi:hypothetical protein
MGTRPASLRIRDAHDTANAFSRGWPASRSAALSAKSLSAFNPEWRATPPYLDWTSFGDIGTLERVTRHIRTRDSHALTATTTHLVGDTHRGARDFSTTQAMPKV